jgi:3-oxoacyl-[acyl-carrier protein] reductase
VAPGLTYSPMTERITANEAARKASESMHALKRLGTPEEVAAALEFFLDPKNSFVTGQVLAVDGGLSCVRAN